MKTTPFTTTGSEFKFAVLDYHVARLGITPRLTPAAELVRLRRAVERPVPAPRPVVKKAA